jgi:hypothetical protein
MARTAPAPTFHDSIGIHCEKDVATDAKEIHRDGNISVGLVSVDRNSIHVPPDSKSTVGCDRCA